MRSWFTIEGQQYTIHGCSEPTSELRLLACGAFLAVTRSFYERFGRNLVRWKALEKFYSSDRGSSKGGLVIFSKNDQKASKIGPQNNPQVGARLLAVAGPEGTQIGTR